MKLRQIFLGQLQINFKKYDYQTTEVTCTCSCGPQGKLVPLYTAKLHTEADKWKQAKGSYVKSHLCNHFQWKALKITHPSSATSALNSTQVSVKHQLYGDIDDSIYNFGSLGTCLVDWINSSVSNAQSVNRGHRAFHSTFSTCNFQHIHSVMIYLFLVLLVILPTSCSYLFTSLLLMWTFSQHHWQTCLPITFCTPFSAYLNNPSSIYKYWAQLMYFLSLFSPSLVTSNVLPQITSLIVHCKDFLAKTASFTAPGQPSLKT